MAEKVKITGEDGREYRLIRYAPPKEGDIFLGLDGGVYTASYTWSNDVVGVCAILEPIPVRHVWGGVVFEEVGEVKSVKPGGWTLARGHRAPGFWPDGWEFHRAVTLLRPVGVEA